MAKVVLEPIGSARETFLDDATWQRQHARRAELIRERETRRHRVR